MTSSAKNIFAEILSKKEHRIALILVIAGVVAGVLLTLLVEPVRVWESITFERLLGHSAPKEATSHNGNQSPSQPPALPASSPASHERSNISSPAIGENGVYVENQGGKGNYQNSPDYSQHIGTQNNEAGHKAGSK